MVGNHGVLCTVDMNNSVSEPVNIDCVGQYHQLFIEFFAIDFVVVMSVHICSCISETIWS